MPRGWFWLGCVTENLKVYPYKVKILGREPKDFSRKILEAIHIRKEKPALNRDKGMDLDPVWDPFLIN